MHWLYWMVCVYGVDSKRETYEIHCHQNREQSDTYIFSEKRKGCCSHIKTRLFENIPGFVIDREGPVQARNDNIQL